MSSGQVVSTLLGSCSESKALISLQSCARLQHRVRAGAVCAWDFERRNSLSAHQPSQCDSRGGIGTGPARPLVCVWPMSLCRLLNGSAPALLSCTWTMDGFSWGAGAAEAAEGLGFGGSVPPPAARTHGCITQRYPDRQ